MEIPDVRYARSGDVAIAYQTIGEGPVDLVFVRGFAGDLLSVWEQPLLVRFVEDLLPQWAPTKADDPEFHRWFVGHMRRGLSPGSALAFFRMMMDSDVGDVLPAVRIPTVVLSSPAERGPGEFFARRIRGARL